MLYFDEQTDFFARDLRVKVMQIEKQKKIAKFYTNNRSELKKSCS